MGWTTSWRSTIVTILIDGEVFVIYVFYFIFLSILRKCQNIILGHLRTVNGELYGQRVYFTTQNVLQQTIQPPSTTLTSFFSICQNDDFARTLLYSEMPKYYTSKEFQIICRLFPCRNTNKTIYIRARKKKLRMYIIKH